MGLATKPMAESIQRITILGTGLIGASIGLALRTRGFRGTIIGWDRDVTQAGVALSRGAIDEKTEDPVTAAIGSDIIVLAGPVFSILEWIDSLGPLLRPGQLVTDVGSVKGLVSKRAFVGFNGAGQAAFLPGHPMAGKELPGAANADAGLFEGAVWLFTPAADTLAHPLAAEWRGWVEKFGCRILDLDAARHDELCAWISHLPQMISTALSALLEERFSNDEPMREQMRAIGGRALREMTRLGASPWSMWRDIAHSNADAIAPAMLALEQTFAHLRENLKTPELREAFEAANEFRAAHSSGADNSPPEKV
jgi:prephenate dehydrogenase